VSGSVGDSVIAVDAAVPARQESAKQPRHRPVVCRATTHMRCTKHAYSAHQESATRAGISCANSLPGPSYAGPFYAVRGRLLHMRTSLG
jgi:hypothetical protein